MMVGERHRKIVTLAYREQGLMTRAGSTLRPTDIADLAETSLRFINRNPGSGTRVWLDAQLRALGVDTAVITGWEPSTPEVRAAAYTKGLKEDPGCRLART